jgi:hypothetical protein
MCTGSSAACPPNPPNIDSDGDGIPDNCDPCTNILHIEVVRPKLLMSRLLAPPGDDRLKFKGTVTVPTTPTIDPSTHGVRLVITDSVGTTMVDAFLPGGALWKAQNGRAWSYRDKTGAVDGVIKASIKSQLPGQLKFVIVGKNGSYLPPAGSPVKASLVIDPPVATTGQCGEATFADNTDQACRLLSAGAKLLCK